VNPKRQRLILAMIAIVSVAGAGLLAALALREEAAFFYTPSEARAATIAAGTSVRLGGMVERESIRRADDGVTIDFRLSDGQATIPVRYTGILPDLFAEGSGAVADGHFEDGLFVADRILAKHDERYMPPQLGDIPANAADTLERSMTE
jgi:cytochrome c-type biogenesis protein CcmE